jgi:hypothetical protein
VKEQPFHSKVGIEVTSESNWGQFQWREASHQAIKVTARMKGSSMIFFEETS